MVIGNVVRTALNKIVLVSSASLMWAGTTTLMPAQAQTPVEGTDTTEVMEEPSQIELEVENRNPRVETTQEDSRPLARPGSLLSLTGAQRLMDEAADAVVNEDYDLAVEKYQDARQVYNQLSNFYQDLSNSFSGVDGLIASALRDRALATAQMRDEATYRLALVHRAQDTPDLAVPLLIQIVRSQQPTRELGGDAYRQLYELGFVDSPYPN
ncbi:MAG: hypothetical protein VKJ64_03260 [Leptolyngbyaceae bacterium]|nr:hypothetical protein [Leptolyngbyaceae bacterium]